MDLHKPYTGTVSSNSNTEGNVGLEVSAVAQRFGIAPATLRSWHRRYGIGPHGHAPGRRRFYRPEDVARLHLMHQALVRGVGPAEAARWALAQPGTGARVHHDADVDRAPESAVAPPADRARPRAPGTGRGGRGLALPGADPAARGLGRAALALDPVAVREVVARCITERGVTDTWDTVARPVLAAVAERWARTGEGIEVEHLLTECLLRELDRSTSGAAPGDTLRPVLLACVPGDHHSLPLSALTAALAEQRVAAHLLGSGLPREALLAAVRRTAPGAVLLWAQNPVPDAGALLPDPGRRCAWFVAGPGWTRAELPASVAYVSSLGGAVDDLGDAVRGRPPAPRP